MKISFPGTLRHKRRAVPRGRRVGRFNLNGAQTRALKKKLARQTPWDQYPRAPFGSKARNDHDMFRGIMHAWYAMQRQFFRRQGRRLPGQYGRTAGQQADYDRNTVAAARARGYIGGR